jgi:hypothetical protein
MATSKVINQQVFKDGKIVLYQLADRPKKLWLCRIKGKHALWAAGTLLSNAYVDLVV